MGGREIVRGRKREKKRGGRERERGRGGRGERKRVREIRGRVRGGKEEVGSGDGGTNRYEIEGREGEKEEKREMKSRRMTEAAKEVIEGKKRVLIKKCDVQRQGSRDLRERVEERGCPRPQMKL